MPSAADEIEQLRAELRRHEHLYYVLDSPQISDAEYDALMRRLMELEAAHPKLARPDSPTQRVGGAPREGFQQVTHSAPMLSLDNALNVEELRAFDERVRGLLGDALYAYVAELKLDEFRGQCPAVGEDVYGVLGVRNSVAALSSYGSGGRVRVEEQLARWRERL